MQINLPSEPYVVVTEKNALEFLEKNWDAYKFDLKELLDFGLEHGMSVKEILEMFATDNHDDIVAELGLGDSPREEAPPTPWLLPLAINLSYFKEKSKHEENR